MPNLKCVFTYGPVLKNHSQSTQHLLFVLYLLKQGYNVITIMDGRTGCVDHTYWPVSIYSNKLSSEQFSTLLEDCSTGFLFRPNKLIVRNCPVSCRTVFLMSEPWQHKWLDFSRNLTELWTCSNTAYESLPVYVRECESKPVQVLIDPCLTTKLDRIEGSEIKLLVPILDEHNYDLFILARYVESLQGLRDKVVVTVLSDRVLPGIKYSEYDGDLEALANHYFSSDCILDLRQRPTCTLGHLLSLNYSKPTALYDSGLLAEDMRDAFMLLKPDVNFRNFRKNVQNIVRYLSPYALDKGRARLKTARDKHRLNYLGNLHRILTSQLKTI